MYLKKQEILKLLDIDDIIVYFQPVVSKEERIVGFEALARGIKNGECINPLSLFKKAGKIGKKVRISLDRLCREIAFKEFVNIYNKNPEIVLFFNFDASLIDFGPKEEAYIYRMAKKYDIPPYNIVIEIAETQVRSLNYLKNFVENYKKLGFLIALDDVGIEYSNLNRIPELKPCLLKIDKSLIKNINSEYHKNKVVKALSSLAREIGALTLAEGVEKETEALTAMQIGVEYFQGFLFAEPLPLKEVFQIDLSCKISKIFNEFKKDLVNSFIKKKKLINKKKKFLRKLAKELELAKEEKFSEILKKWITKEKALESLGVVNEEGILITGKIFSKDYKLHPSPFFKPAMMGKNLFLRDYIYPILSGLTNSFITEPYVSLDTGNIIVTFSYLFRNISQKKYIICATFKTNFT